ncbi:MAG: biotin carboxylase N-terminal domain-containing protein [Chloroflexota bacterium]
MIRTCRRLGIRTIAVYSDADWDAPHVRSADEAHRIGAGPAADSYLRASAIVELARATGAEAIHPGYGFLAENPDVAEAVEDAGLAWVGPPPAAMRALGDKARAKALAEANRVPVLPGYHADMAADDDLVARADGIGFPLLVKASAGGGGRGMRLVRAPSELPEALAAARREALAAFGDDRLLLERYLERPRHVEIQVLGDAHGTLVHLGERECSIQRRHQKLIEESPSPAVSPELRTAMGDAALRLARAAGYRNAGTVEFLLDGTGAFYFLEVNARLQVEHPVTEAVTGLDLVEQQLRVAAGEPLGFGQADVRPEGHAMELRIVAEDATAGFLPSTGAVTRFDVPTSVRVDTGIACGSTISPFYDSLVAKLVAHARDRAASLERLREALDATQIEGVATNVDLLAAVLDEPAFAAGDLHAGFLEEHRVADRLAEVPPEVVAAAAAARSLAPGDGDRGDPWRRTVPWRVARTGEPSRWLAGGRTFAAVTSLDAAPATATVVVGTATVVGGSRSVRARLGGGDPDAGWTIAIADERALVRPATGGRRVETVTWRGRRHRLALAAAPSGELAVAEADEPDALAAPMPGRVVRVLVAEGDHVRANAPLVILEAMKMEHVIAATAPGRVTRLHVAAGDQVLRGAPLVDLDAAEAP